MSDASTVRLAISPRLGWMHLAGFLVVSAVVFTLGLASGRLEARKIPSSRPSEATFEATDGGGGGGQIQKISLAESTFTHEIPAYPRALSPEIPAGQLRDAFGFETKAKSLSTKDKPELVLLWYDQVFRMRSCNVYHVENDLFTALAAIDTFRKQMYYITITPSPDRTQVTAAWADGTKAPSKRSELIPLDLGESQPMMLSGDGKLNEMAVYMVDGGPSDAYARYSRQLETQGWRPTEPPGDEAARRLREHQRSYVRGDREFVMTASTQGEKTVLMCIVSPRVG